MGELQLIERIRRQAQSGVRGSGVRLGIGDDCAVLRVPRGHEMVVTTDFSLEGRHFRRDWHSAASAGHRCLARGLSDLAAMGAWPAGVFLSLALPAAYEAAWVDGFLDGLLALAAEHGVELAGGDTAEAPGAEVLADIVCVGSVPRGRALLRSGAWVGGSDLCEREAGVGRRRSWSGWRRARSVRGRRRRQGWLRRVFRSLGCGLAGRSGGAGWRQAAWI